MWSPCVPIDTRTLGRLDHPEPCAYPLHLVAGAKRFPTFGELLRALSTANRPFDVGY
jgi:hypothetical protein